MKDRIEELRAHIQSNRRGCRWSSIGASLFLGAAIGLWLADRPGSAVQMTVLSCTWYMMSFAFWYSAHYWAQEVRQCETTLKRDAP